MTKHRIRWSAAAAGVAASAMLAATFAVGATPAAGATKSAFVIGFINSTQGAVAFPGLSDGAQAAVQYVNAHGGINGHPLVLAVCDVDASAEKNQACGNQVANDSRLKMVMTGFTLAPGPMIAGIGNSGLPILQAFPTADAEYTAPNAVAYNGGAPGATIGTAELANSSNAKTTSRYTNDTPGLQANTNFFMARYKGPASGVKTVVVPATATDSLPYLLQGSATSVDFNMVAVGNCLPFARALAQLGVPGTKVGASTSCVSQTNIQGPNGAQFEGWRAAYFYQDAAFGPITPDLKVLIADYPKYAKMPTTAGFAAYVSQGWGPILTLQKALRGKPDSVLNDKKQLFNALRAYRGPGVLTAPSMKCGSVKGLPSLCTTWTMKGQVRGGKVYRVAG